MFLSVKLPDLSALTLRVRGLFVLITMWSEFASTCPAISNLTLPDENQSKCHLI